MVSYQIDISSVVDFRCGFSSQWAPLWQDFGCDWRKLYFCDGIEPPSWVLGDQVIESGAKGIMFKSVITGGTNLVLYTGALDSFDSIFVHDPNNDLPKNQDAWK